MSQPSIVSDPGRGRAYRLLALVGLIVALLVAWSFWDSQRRTIVREPPQTERVIGDQPDASGPGAGVGPVAGEAAAAQPSAGLIRGQIIDPVSGPLTEGRIELHCSGGFLAATAVEQEGTFEGPACAEGTTCVRLIHPGVEQPRAWELEPNTPVQLQAQPAPSVSGVVVDAGGDPVAGAELLVRRGAAQITIGTDAAGEFAVAIPRLRPCDRCEPSFEPNTKLDCRGPNTAGERGPVRVLAMAPGHAPVETELELAGGLGVGVGEGGGEPVRLVLPPAAPAITGVVRGRDGAPFDARTRVLATNIEREYEQHAAPVDARGQFRFGGLAPAEYSLRAVRDGREIAELALARPGDELELRSDLSAQGSTLTVEVVDADGAPVVGARIDGGPLRAAFTDINGEVEVAEVLPGNYTLRIRASDCAVIREAVELAADRGPWLHTVRVPANC